MCARRQLQAPVRPPTLPIIRGEFSTIHSLRTDLDKTTMPRCDSQRSHLGDALLVPRCDCLQRWILEDLIPPLRKRGPCLWLNSVGLQKLDL